MQRPHRSARRRIDPALVETHVGFGVGPKRRNKAIAPYKNWQRSRRAQSLYCACCLSNDNQDVCPSAKPLAHVALWERRAGAIKVLMD
jgi:hypothetical protein